MISCQVCKRTMRWHNGPIRRSRNPTHSQVFQDCDSKWEESVAHSILARSSFTPPKAVYMSADQLCPSHFSLAIRRRTIQECITLDLYRKRPGEQASRSRLDRAPGRFGSSRKKEA